MSDRADAAEVYRLSIVEQLPRVLGLIDRSPLSPTVGCCDRTYWSWKFVDFPRARFQEAVCVMAYAYTSELGYASAHRSRRLLGWVQDGLRFWSSIQHPDGSLDEAYRGSDRWPPPPLRRSM